MPFTLTLNEPKSAKYIHIDAEGHLHLLFPIVRVDKECIALDNTCKTAIEQQLFFYGETKSPADKSPSALEILLNYEAALIKDINICSIINNDSLRAIKEVRLNDVRSYQSLLRTLISQDNIVDCLHPRLEYPSLPTEVKMALQKKTNCLSIQLSPKKPDYALRAVSPVFSLQRNEYQPHVSMIEKEGLGLELRTTQAKIIPKIKTHKQRLIDDTELYFSNNNLYSFTKLNQFLQNELLRRFQKNIDFSTITENQLREIRLYDETDTIAEHAENILNFNIVNDAFWEQLSPNAVDNPHLFIDPDPEKRSMKIQFFLAQVNLYCYINQISTENFGTYFDSPTLRDRISLNVSHALLSGTRIDECLFGIIDVYQLPFKMTRTLNSDDKKIILTNFKTQFEAIQHSPHFDEFLIFQPEVKGDFVVHDGKMSLSFTPFAEKQLTQKTAKTTTALNMLKLNQPGFVRQQGRRLSADNSAFIGENVFNQHQFPTLLSLIGKINRKKLADLLCLKSNAGDYYFEHLPDYSIAWLQTQPDWNNLIKTMRSNLDESVHERLSDFNTKIDRAQSLIIQDKITRLPENMKTKLINEQKLERITFFNDSLDTLIDNYMNSITWIKKLFGSSRKKEISKINELRPTNNDSIQIIREKLAGLQTLEYTIGKEFRWFSRTSHLQNLLKSNITLLQEKLASFENQCSTLMQQEILAQQNTRLQNNQSPLHLLNANWWLPENNVYLNKLIALTRYSTVEAIIFFNQCEPKQLNAALIKGLEISPPDFSVVVEINTLIEIGQKQLSIETPSPKNTFTAKTAFFAEGLKALSIVAEAGIQPWLKR